MKLKKNIRLLGRGRLSSATASIDNIDVYIAETSGIVGLRFSTENQTLSNLGRVSFADDYYDLNFTRAEKRFIVQSVG